MNLIAANGICQQQAKVPEGLSVNTEGGNLERSCTASPAFRDKELDDQIRMLELDETLGTLEVSHETEILEQFANVQPAENLLQQIILALCQGAHFSGSGSAF